MGHEAVSRGFLADGCLALGLAPAIPRRSRHGRGFMVPRFRCREALTVRLGAGGFTPFTFSVPSNALVSLRPGRLGVVKGSYGAYAKARAVGVHQVQIGREVIGGPWSSAALDKYAVNLFG